MTITARLIKSHCGFTQIDTYETPLYPRKWQYLHNHVIIHHQYLEMSVLLQSKDKLISKFDEQKLIDKINSLENRYLKDSKVPFINLNQCNYMTNFGRTISIEDFDGHDRAIRANIFQQLYWFVYAYKLAYSKINKPINDALEEYHEAMNYMAPTFYKQPDEFDYGINIKIIQYHLLRGTLKASKAIMEFKKDIILKDERLLGAFYRLKSIEDKGLGITTKSNPKNGNDIVLQYIKFIKKIENL